MPTPLDEGVRQRIAAARGPSLAAARAWRASEAYRSLERRFAALDVAESAAEVATDLLGGGDWAAELLAPLVAGLAADPFFEPPIRASRDAFRTGAILYEDAGVSITASVLSAAALAVSPPPRSVVVPGRLAITRYVRAGGARLLRWRADAVQADFCAATTEPCAALPDRALRDGDVVRIDGRTDGHLLAGASGDVAALTVTIRHEAAPLMREYAIPGGALIRVAALDDRASRTAMLLTFLRHLGRTDAAPAFEAATRDPAFFVRWEAMREWLALDALAAHPRLARMAESDANAEVRAAATATLALVEARMPCPA